MTLAGEKVYFPVESLTGLGHFNRAGKIVREMVKAGLDVTVASGTFVDPGRFFAGARHAEIPAYAFRAGQGFYTRHADGKRTIIPAFNAGAQNDGRVAAHVENIRALRPGVIASEFWPFDRPNFDREMEAMLRAARSSAHDSLRIVSVRDVLNAPGGVDAGAARKGENPAPARDEWAARTINENFHAVLVHGDPQFIPLSETFPAYDRITADVIYTGYVTNDLPARAKAPGDGGPAPFLVSCGSGIDGDELLFSFLTAWEKLLDRRGRDAAAAHVANRPVHIVCGPRFFDGAYAEIGRWARALQEKSGQDVRVDKYRQDYTSLLAQAAFSVSLAGYNTTLETLAIGTPALFVPNYIFTDGTLKVNSEQLYRLMRLEQKGLASHAHPRDVQNSGVFADRIVHEFIRQTTQGAPRARLDFSGAENTMEAISGLLKAHRKRAPASTAA